eukprot:355127-Chlamydomonas_euryale.AAC.20
MALIWERADANRDVSSGGRLSCAGSRRCGSSGGMQRGQLLQTCVEHAHASIPRRRVGVAPRERNRWSVHIDCVDERARARPSLCGSASGRGCGGGARALRGHEREHAGAGARVQDAQRRQVGAGGRGVVHTRVAHMSAVQQVSRGPCAEQHGIGAHLSRLKKVWGDARY